MNHLSKLTGIVVVIILSILSVLYGFKRPTISNNSSVTKDTTLPKHFCVIKGPERKPELLIESLADRNYVWDKTTLNVFFWEKDDWGIFDKVLKIASEWTPYSGVKFKRVYKREDSDIRVSVTEKGFWSYIGSYAQTVGKNSITLSLDRIYLPQNEARFRNVILHEFGHALGLMHELQHPNWVIPWKKKELFKFFYDTYKVDSNWVNEQVIKKYESPTGIYCDVDPLSIMIYAIPEGVTENNAFVSDWPDNLSALDKKNIGPICKHKKCK